MPSFPKPKFDYTVNVASEIKALRNYRDTHEGMQVPASKPNNLLIATWNIANLGDQQRQKEHLKIIAELISWYDLIAIQETKENSEHFQTIVSLLGTPYKFVFSDEGGNRERMAFIYNSNKILVREEIAELTISPDDYKNIKLPGVAEKFEGFDRSPYMVSFRVNKFDFLLLNVHLYFGDDTEDASINRRCLEAFAVARWADLRSKSKYAFTNTVLTLGDFNLPKLDESDKIYKALLSKGLQLPEHSSRIYSNINNDKSYDQIAFLPGIKDKILSTGIFPFDNIIFADMYKSKTGGEFKGYLKYYLSDHRPMWMELDVK
jgi:endonuclease/exonuclease/phosphatase family metal-dependent hydrolase